MTTNFDVGNMQMLSAGARASANGGNGWRTMDSAPRDGSYVELECRYGVAPWYCIARWTDEVVSSDQNGLRHTWKQHEKSWQKPEGGGPFSEGSLRWRPYNGEVSAYSDPTGGAQDSPAYWRGAIAAKYGLPLDAFEEDTRRNVARNAKVMASEPASKVSPSWWDRVRAWFAQ